MGVIIRHLQILICLQDFSGQKAEGEGEQGMLMVGNVGINRLRANCSVFKGLRTIPEMVYQSPCL